MSVWKGLGLAISLSSVLALMQPVSMRHNLIKAENQKKEKLDMLQPLARLEKARL